ncbi:phosphoenolpyruvate carboxylase [uncultured Methanospirillum sp.]|uniref:phosphoenolpyruvate carboxylase n=1 Tax=uncultured Methanospirillum sp. TaxID=262503 RepID=UPI0029C93672|nr:phosphoenolpyruvate carboxylase [uncultured Methanospirillum sp.]
MTGTTTTTTSNHQTNLTHDIPRTMSTQHPDNVTTPFFAANPELSGEDEVREAFYIFSHLGCREQMWDCEGKEVDNFVVKKLLSRYPEYFHKNQLGKNRLLTLRVPNPEFERAEAKILLETLGSIPRSYDIASLFYGDETPPIFEVILPMTTSYSSIDNIYQYYRDFVVGQQHQRLGGRDSTIADWIGSFHPDRINVIPLFEDRDGMLNAASIVRRYMQDKNLPYQRVFLARSDPAVNYGQIGAILLNKIALWNLSKLSDETGVPICPIIGAGSAPFRGNLRPDTVQRVVQEYPGAYTFTIQSAFKYDYPLSEAAEGIRFLEERSIEPATYIDEEESLILLDRYSAEYQKQIIALAPMINRIAGHIPGRRKRKLHIGLFGYSRSMGEVSLPRAITVTAALYSIGIPPEILGMNALTPDDIAFLKSTYVNFESDMADAVRFLNPDSVFLPQGVAQAVEEIVPIRPDPEHQEIARRIEKGLAACQMESFTDLILQAGHIRKFLG